MYYFSIRKENRSPDSLPFIFELFQRVVDIRKDIAALAVSDTVAFNLLLQFFRFLCTDLVVGSRIFRKGSGKQCFVSSVLIPL